MQDDVVRLRDQAVRARWLAGLTTDLIAINELKAYAAECDANADALDAAQKAAKDQLSRF